MAARSRFRGRTTVRRARYTAPRRTAYTPPAPQDERQEAVAAYQQRNIQPIRTRPAVNTTPNNGGSRRSGKGYQGSTPTVPMPAYESFLRNQPAPNFSLRWQYDANGNPVQITDPNAAAYATAMGWEAPITNQKVFGTGTYNPPSGRGLHSRVTSFNKTMTMRAQAVTPTGNAGKIKTNAPGSGMAGKLPGYPPTSDVLPPPPQPDYGYPGWGGGGGDYSGSSYSSPFSEYRPGYAREGSAPTAAMRYRAPAAYNNGGYNNAQAQYPARWQQLLTTWKI